MAKIAVALLVAILCVAHCMIQVDPSTQFMVDEYGRVRIFHGVNAVFKTEPWHPQTEGFDPQLSLSAEDAENLYTWGFNAVRLGMMWPGVAPEQGVINQTYIDVMKSIVQNLGSKGIYTILDAHQDIISRKFCGEGAPDWLVDPGVFSLPFPLPVTEAPYPIDSNGYPSLSQCLQYNFADYYFSYQVSATFQQLYDDTNNMQTEFANYWDTVSSQFKGTDTVLGYELINEPWAGDVFFQPDLLEPGVADKQNLAPMYERLHNVIRQNDNDTIIFFERTVSDLTESGLPSGPGGVGYNDKQVFSYHIYCAPTDRQGNPTNIIECDAVDEYTYWNSYKDVLRLGTGGFMTAMTNASVAIESLDFLASEADKRLQSWSYWQFKLYNDLTTSGQGESFYVDGQLEETKLKVLSRTYAQAVAGTPTTMYFNSGNANFNLVFNVDATIKAPTIIYLNEELYYPHGFFVTIDPQVLSWTQPDSNYINLIPNSQVTNGQQVTVTIQPRL